MSLSAHIAAEKVMKSPTKISEFKSTTVLDKSSAQILTFYVCVSIFDLTGIKS